MANNITSWSWEKDHFEEVALISVEDRGFRYGMSVFETVAVVQGKAVFLLQHIERLQLAAVELEFPINHAALLGISTFLQHPPFQEGLVRVYWTAGDGGPADPITEGRFILRCEEMPLPGSLAPMRDLLLTTLRVNFSELDSWKTGNYLKRCRLLAEARKAQAEEALLLDHSNLLVGAIMANVFLVTDSGQLVTPAFRAGCRNGTVREWIMKHHDVKEKELSLAEVVSAQGILLTNSRLGVASVESLEKRKLGKEEISQRVKNSYTEFLLSHGRRSRNFIS